MPVLIDSSVWSLSLRRNRRDLSPPEKAIVFQCRDLLAAGDAALIGLILQETLSGIAESENFEGIKERMLSALELPVDSDTHILSAQFYNICRAHGVAPGHIDMTICASAHIHNTPIFTADPDFKHYAKHLPISLHHA